MQGTKQTVDEDQADMISNCLSDSLSGVHCLYKDAAGASIYLQANPHLATARSRLYFAAPSPLTLKRALQQTHKALNGREQTYCVFAAPPNQHSEETAAVLKRHYSGCFIFRNLIYPLKAEPAATSAPSKKFSEIDFVSIAEAQQCYHRMLQLFKPSCAFYLVSYQAFLRLCARHQLLAVRGPAGQLCGVVQYELTGRIIDIQQVFKLSSDIPNISSLLLDKSIAMARLQGKPFASLWYESTLSEKVGQIYRNYGFKDTKKQYYCFF